MGDIHPGSLGGTYGGNPIACATALKVIEIMEREDIPGRAEKMGIKLRKRLNELQEMYPMIGDVRAVIEYRRWLSHLSMAA